MESSSIVAKGVAKQLGNPLHKASKFEIVEEVVVVVVVVNWDG